MSAVCRVRPSPQRIATDIAHLNTRCKELQAAVDHSSLKASHDNEGLRKETANNIEILRVNTMDTVDEINKMLTKKVAGLTDDVASLNDALSTEKADRTTSDDNLNTKLLQQCEKVSMIATTDARTPTLSWSLLAATSVDDARQSIARPWGGCLCTNVAFCIRSDAGWLGVACARC